MVMKNKKGMYILTNCVGVKYRKRRSYVYNNYIAGWPNSPEELYIGINHDAQGRQSVI